MPWTGDGAEQGFLPNSIADIINKKEGNKRLELDDHKKITTPFKHSNSYDNTGNTTSKVSKELLYNNYVTNAKTEYNSQQKLSWFFRALEYASTEDEKFDCYKYIFKEYAQQQDYNSAIEYCNHSLEIKPDNKYVHECKLLYCMRSKNYAQAIQSVDILKNKSKYAIDFATCYKNLGEYSNAIKFYNKAIERDTNDYIFYMHRASCYLLQKDYQTALDDIKIAISLCDDENIVDKLIKLQENCLYNINRQTNIPEYEKKNYTQDTIEQNETTQEKDENTIATEDETTIDNQYHMSFIENDLQTDKTHTEAENTHPSAKVLQDSEQEKTLDELINLYLSGSMSKSEFLANTAKMQDKPNVINDNYTTKEKSSSPNSSKPSFISKMISLVNKIFSFIK